MSTPPDRVERPSEPAPDDADLLPAVDVCHHPFCGRPRADHTRTDVAHPFAEPRRRPRPERIVEAHIVTSWTCSHCGAHNDVWGIADGWMDCPECRQWSCLV